MTRRQFMSRVLQGTLVWGAMPAATLLISGCAKEAPSRDTPAQSAQSSGASSESRLFKPIEGAYATGLHHAILELEGGKQVELELNATIAPITVSNFCDLVEKKFYDGLTFHRIIKDFMAQGGDPKGDGTGGATRTIHGEFSENGEVNPIAHKRGTISMARAQDPDSASSQFFIMFKDNASLDGKYAAFGNVIAGMEFIDELANVEAQDNNGTIEKDKQPKIVSIRMKD